MSKMAHELLQFNNSPLNIGEICGDLLSVLSASSMTTMQQKAEGLSSADCKILNAMLYWTLGDVQEQLASSTSVHINKLTTALHRERWNNAYKHAETCVHPNIHI